MNYLNRVSDVAGKLPPNPAVDNNGHRDHLDPETVAVAASRNGYRALILKPNPESLLVFASQPAGAAAEQYRQLRRNLTEHFPEGATLMVTSPAQAEGKTMNSLNLAWCLAESGAPTLLVEADLRRPTIARVLESPVPQGVETAFRGEVDPKMAVAAVEGLPLYVAAVAKPVKEPGQLIKSSGTRRFMDWARGEFRWVVIDAPPVLPAADALELSPLADACLLVARVRVTPRELLEKSFQLLGNRLRGIILNEASLCWDSYHRYLGHYYGPRTQ